MAKERWEALSPLRRACCNAIGVVVDSSLYALEGYDIEKELDLVQKLSLESITWELMQLRLPYAGRSIPCFKLNNTEVYLVVNNTLCSFNALEVRSLKRLAENMHSLFGEELLPQRNSLLLANGGAVREIGSLSSS
jgi:hypothetical protein